jgi:hypothetical protein
MHGRVFSTIAIITQLAIQQDFVSEIWWLITWNWINICVYFFEVSCLKYMIIVKVHYW